MGGLAENLLVAFLLLILVYIPTGRRADGAADQLSPPAALQLFRFIQKALTNVRKHARAQKATVTLASNGPDQLRVVIAGDGQGFPSLAASGMARRGLWA